MRATVAFADADAFAAALDAGTPVPADTPVPVAPVAAPAKVAAARTTRKSAVVKNAEAADETVTKAPAKKAPAKKAPAKKAAEAVGKAAKIIEEAVEPVVKAVRSRKAAPKTKSEASVAASLEGPDVETFPQPEAVAVAGDFNTLLGAPENWAPQYDEAQMAFDFVAQQWKISAELPAGYYTFKIALNRSWEENYGAFGTFDGPNHELHHDGGTVTIRYDHRTRDITIN